MCSITVRNHLKPISLLIIAEHEIPLGSLFVPKAEQTKKNLKWFSPDLKIIFF